MCITKKGEYANDCSGHSAKHQTHDKDRHGISDFVSSKQNCQRTSKAPKLEAKTTAHLESASDVNTPPKILAPKISKATPRLAPEEIPRTKGPASGFLNKVLHEQTTNS